MADVTSTRSRRQGLPVRAGLAIVLAVFGNAVVLAVVGTLGVAPGSGP